MYRVGVELEAPRPRTVPDAIPSHGWRTVSLVTWLATLAALVAVAISSRTIGRPLWWLGTRFHPAHPLLMLIPLALIAVPIVATWRSPGMMVRANIACSLALIATALPDLASSMSVAIAVVVVGTASLTSAIAQLLATRNYG